MRNNRLARPRDDGERLAPKVQAAGSWRDHQLRISHASDEAMQVGIAAINAGAEGKVIRTNLESGPVAFPAMPLDQRQVRSRDDDRAGVDFRGCDGGVRHRTPLRSEAGAGAGACRPETSFRSGMP